MSWTSWGGTQSEFNYDEDGVVNVTPTKNGKKRRSSILSGDGRNRRRWGYKALIRDHIGTQISADEKRFKIAQEQLYFQPNQSQREHARFVRGDALDEKRFELKENWLQMEE